MSKGLRDDFLGWPDDEGDPVEPDSKARNPSAVIWPACGSRPIILFPNSLIHRTISNMFKALPK